MEKTVLICHYRDKRRDFAFAPEQAGCAPREIIAEAVRQGRIPPGEECYFYVQNSHRAAWSRMRLSLLPGSF